MEIKAKTGSLVRVLIAESEVQRCPAIEAKSSSEAGPVLGGMKCLGVGVVKLGERDDGHVGCRKGSVTPGECAGASRRSGSLRWGLMDRQT